VVGLLEAINTLEDLNPLTSKWMRYVRRQLHYHLSLRVKGHMEEGAFDIKV
jgi:hypothetical protein